MHHEAYKEMLALEALGALPASDSRSLAEHLASCDECRRELAEASDTAASLAYTVLPVAPPAHLRTRIIESVRTSEHSRVAANSVETVEPASWKRADSSKVSEVRRLLRQLGTWDILRARPPLAFGAMAAAVLIAVLAVSTLVLWGQYNGLRSEVARLNRNIKESQEEVARGREMLAQTREVSDILTSPGAQVVRLAGTDVAPRASARVVVNPETGQALLVASDLPPVPSGMAYQLWYIANGKPMPGGVFTTDGAGRAVLHERVPEAGRAASLFAVTLEPAGGVLSPTGEKFLLGQTS